MSTLEIWLIVGLSISFILNIIFIFGIWNLLKQTEALEDLVSFTIRDTRQKVTTALLAMEAADIRGSFASDDEVGVAFKDIKSIIKELNKEF